jgi:hypothetical protein
MGSTDLLINNLLASLAYSASMTLKPIPTPREKKKKFDHPRPEKKGQVSSLSKSVKHGIFSPL